MHNAQLCGGGTAADTSDIQACFNLGCASKDGGSSRCSSATPQSRLPNRAVSCHREPPRAVPTRAASPAPQLLRRVPDGASGSFLFVPERHTAGATPSNLRAGSARPAVRTAGYPGRRRVTSEHRTLPVCSSGDRAPARRPGRLPVIDPDLPHPRAAATSELTRPEGHRTNYQRIIDTRSLPARRPAEGHPEGSRGRRAAPCLTPAEANSDNGSAGGGERSSCERLSRRRRPRLSSSSVNLQRFPETAARVFREYDHAKRRSEAPRCAIR